MNVLAEPPTVKQRVHLDVPTDSVETLTALGASVLETYEQWTVLADPEGGELCAFVREAPPDYRLYEVVVDADPPEVVGGWWSQVFGVEMQHNAEQGFCWIGPVPHAPLETTVFNPVPEPKTVPQIAHPPGRLRDRRAAAGRTRRRAPAVTRARHRLVRARRPPGNELCAFVE